jgi:ABC-type multidrug transport system fused ATPase/permease subunit
MTAMFKLSDTVPVVTDAPDAVVLDLSSTASDGSASLRFENVSFGYKEGHDVLRNLNLEVRSIDRSSTCPAYHEC